MLTKPAKAGSNLHLRKLIVIKPFYAGSPGVHPPRPGGGGYPAKGHPTPRERGNLREEHQDRAGQGGHRAHLHAGGGRGAVGEGAAGYRPDPAQLRPGHRSGQGRLDQSVKGEEEERWKVRQKVLKR